MSKKPTIIISLIVLFMVSYNWKSKEFSFEFFDSFFSIFESQISIGILLIHHSRIVHFDFDSAT